MPKVAVQLVWIFSSNRIRFPAKGVLILERRLAVLMSADLVGFTRLMERDEAGTWAQLRALRKDAIDPAIDQNGGVIFKTTGDGMLAEFKSAVDAVQASVAVQNAVYLRNKEVPPEQRLTFRVGIDQGDVIVDGDDLIGDAVNVAARLEGICQPGGVCISEVVHTAARRNCTIAFEDIGDVKLHNRNEPVHCYVWRYGTSLDTDEAWHTLKVVRTTGSIEKRRPSERRSSTGLKSVAVLPFQNFSNDEDMEYLGSGIAEDITTELYRFKSFSVIARTSTFLYSDENLAAQDIGRELGADYVLEGSIRKLGERLRITAQLIDIDNNDHIWAERFDLNTADIFDAQDKIIAQIVGTMSNDIDRHRLRKSRHLSPAELEAYELMLRGLELHKQGYVSYEHAVEAHRLFSEAVAKDPSLARARAWKVCAASRLIPASAPLEDVGAVWQEYLDELKTVFEINEDEPEAHRIYGAISLYQGEFEQARFHVEKALAANPNNPHILAKSANFFSHYGMPQKSLELLNYAVAINPHHPDWYWQEFGLAHWVSENYAASIDHFSRSTSLADFDHAYMAASHVGLGEDNAAARNAQHFREINPETTADIFAVRQPFRSEEVRQRLKQQLVEAGMPE